MFGEYQEAEYKCPYWKLSKGFLILYGLWPYQPKITKYIFYALFMTVAISISLPMLIGLHDAGDFRHAEPAIFLSTLSSILFYLCGIASGTLLYIKGCSARELYEIIQVDWKTIKDQEELRLLYKKSCQGRNMIFIYICFTVPCSALSFLASYLYITTDERSIDDTYIFPYYADWFVLASGIRKMQIYAHYVLSFVYVGTVYTATIAMYVCSVKHVCGMFVITRYEIACSYRLKKLIDLSGGDCLNYKIDRVPGLINVIRLHEETIEKVKLIDGLFSRTFFVLDLCRTIGIASLIFDVNHSKSTILGTLQAFLVAMMIIVNAFFLNYVGEEVLHYSNNVHRTTYNSKWYVLPTRVKKLLVMILMRSGRANRLSSGLMILSLRNFAKLLETSWSIAAVLITTQRRLLLK